MEISIDINTDCKNNCVFCAKFSSEQFVWGKIKLEKLKKNILEKINKEGSIYIGGPEPFNYEFLLDFLVFIKGKTNKKIIIKTSGVIGDLRIINSETLKYIDKIQIPCNSLNEKDFNYIYQNKEAYLKYNNLLEQLEKLDISEKLIFHTLVLKENYEELPNILLYLHKKFFVRELVIVYPIKPFIKAKNYYDITIPRELITSRYKKFITKNIFKLINFDDTLENYEKNNFGKKR